MYWIGVGKQGKGQKFQFQGRRFVFESGGGGQNVKIMEAGSFFLYGLKNYILPSKKVFIMIYLS